MYNNIFQKSLVIFSVCMYKPLGESIYREITTDKWHILNVVEELSLGPIRTNLDSGINDDLN